MSSGDETYAVPKRGVPALVRVPGRDATEGVLHLSEAAARHRGPELPSDLLNGEGDFLPIADAATGKLRLVRRRSLLWVSVDLSIESRSEASPVVGGDHPEAVDERVRIRFEDGSDLTGLLRWVLPAGRQRVRDFLEQAEPFFPLYAGDRVTFVNAERVASVDLE